jgi:hypothetical protein
MKITPALIPHADFHKGTWLLSVERPGWYYFMRKKNLNTITNKNFLKSVDKPLRRLVKWLHERGIKTTPSCSGHHISERDLEKIYSGLEQDRDAIRNGGLKLKDIETGSMYYYKDSNYNLPWNKQDFIDEVTVYQQTGVIGLRLGNRKREKEKILELFRNFPANGITVEEKDSIILIFTNENQTGNNKKTWKKITRVLQTVLEERLKKQTPV